MKIKQFTYFVDKFFFSIQKAYLSRLQTTFGRSRAKKLSVWWF